MGKCVGGWGNSIEIDNLEELFSFSTDTGSAMEGQNGAHCDAKPREMADRFAFFCVVSKREY
jgi:hypothetical protein